MIPLLLGASLLALVIDVKYFGDRRVVRGFAGQKRIARIPVMAVRFQNLEVFPEWVEAVICCLSASKKFKIVPAFLRDPDNGLYTTVSINTGELELLVDLVLKGSPVTGLEELLYTVYHNPADRNNGVIAQMSHRVTGDTWDDRETLLKALRLDLELVAKLQELVS